MSIDVDAALAKVEAEKAGRLARDAQLTEGAGEVPGRTRRSDPTPPRCGDSTEGAAIRLVISVIIAASHAMAIADTGV